MKDRLRLLDLRLLVPVLLLIFMGTLTLYSAGRGTVYAHHWIKQILWNLIGLALMAYLAGSSHRRIFGLALPLYGLGLLSLVLVLLIGKEIAGARAWFSIGGQTLQPAEFVKWITLLYVAHRLGNRPFQDLSNRELLGSAAILVFPITLIMKQPDLGMALTFMPIFLLLLLVRGLSLRWVLAGALVAGAGATWWWNFKAMDYQRDRVLTFLDKSKDTQGKGYQVDQSRIAIGAGGLMGQGFTAGSQTQLNFLPVKTTDFAFSAWAEERGYVGVLGALLLFGFLLKRLLDIAQEARTAAGTYFAFGVAGVFGIHILVNVGMVVGAVPTTGIPLPFFTYGGSSTWAFFLALGVVLNIHHHAKVR